MGELIAWVCGWCLVLEYGVSVAAVAVGWGEYLNELLKGTIGVTIPAALSAPPGDGGVFNLPALIVVLLAMVFLMGGAKESARANTIMVCVKIAALVMFCAIGVQGFRSGNYSHFMPLGMSGVSAAGATLFFSYIGFDAASTAGEEAKNAQRDLPRAIMLSLVIVTALYVLVAAVAVGAKPGRGSTTPRPRSPRSCATSPARASGAPAGLLRGHRHRERGPDRPLRPDPHPVRDVPRRLVPKVFSRVHPRSGARAPTR